MKLIHVGKGGSWNDIQLNMAKPEPCAYHDDVIEWKHFPR